MEKNFGDQNMSNENRKKYMILTLAVSLLVINFMPVVTSTNFTTTYQTTTTTTKPVDISIQKNENKLTLQYEINHYTLNELTIDNIKFLL